MSTKRYTQRFLSLLVILSLAMFIAVTSAFAEPWKFGVMSDTQWKTSPDAKNPNTVAVGPIVHLNEEFKKHGVKFVIQTGDLTENGSDLEMDTTATFRQALYNAGIGFYPLRGNHDTISAIRFLADFPQTQTGINNQTPTTNLVTTPYYGNPIDPANPYNLFNTNSTFTVGSNFSGPTDIDPNYAGLTYSFDYDNARFVILDTFTIPNIACNLLETQQAWITSTLSGRPAKTHAFVFSHKGLMTENHTDILFTARGKCDGSSTGSTPAVKLAEQNTFIGSLNNNGVRYLFNGHDHMHNRNIVTSPDALSKVMDITTASNSYKYYIPLIPDSDFKYNNQNGAGPATGNSYPRETEIAQELFTQGYYIVTVDGPRVTVDFYSSPNGCNGDCDQTDDRCSYIFTKRETFGYSLNGKEVLVKQGESYAGVQDSFEGTTAKILAGVNGSTAKVYDGRATTKAVNTGWTSGSDADVMDYSASHRWPWFSKKRYHGKDAEMPASDILTLWGMADLRSDQTDVYTLSMSYDQHKLLPIQLGKGMVGLATKDEDGDWVNAVDMNSGGTKKFVFGPWKPGYELGTYGIDLKTHTAWAVINYNGDFAVAGFGPF